MAYFHGDFRSIDTTNDTKGQRYRVVIFTGYTGTNPYQYIELDNPPYAPIRFPNTGTALTMADHPFILNYEGDAENIYKPYRCSTATISFRQSSIRPEMLNSNGRGTLVVLLKWKNEVSEVGGAMYNSITGEHLNKLLVERNDLRYFYGYEPCALEKFCFNVEWVGYATPETFSMEYDHVSDTFTLNAQDALSTLRYRKATANPESNALTSANAEILGILQELTGYKKVYITDTIKYTTFQDATADIYTQTHNNLNEDNEPVNQLTELSRILTYLGLTATPHTDSLILTTPDAVTNGWNNYFVYALPDTGYILNWSSDGATYSAQPTEYLADSLTLNADCFTGGTSISTSNIYSKVTATVDNYEVGELMPDITDDERYTAPANMTVDYYSDTTSTDPIYYAWERKAVNIPADSRVMVKHWAADTFGGIWSATELTETPSVTDYGKAGCYILEHGGVVQTDTANTLPLNSNYGRDYYFHTGRMVLGTFSGQNRQTYYDDKENAWQPHLIFNSDNVLFYSGDHLNICGEWFFYCNRDKSKLQPKSLNTNYANATTARRTGNLNTYYNYIWAKVSVAGQWLTNDGEKYAWTATETPCKIYLDWEEEKKAFDTPYPFKQTHRNISGTCILLPVSGENVVFGNIHIEIDRPLGVYRYACECALLRDFSVQVIKIDDRSHRNTEYVTDIDSDAVSDYTIEGSIGSEHTSGALWSQAVKGDSDTYTQIPPIYNVATGKYTIPESHATTNAANQYSTPTISLQTTIHSTLKPYTLVTWGQLNGKKFIVDGLERDFEYNTDMVRLVEVKAPQTFTTSRRNVTKNYKRNGDLVQNPDITRRNTAMLTPTAAGTITSFALNDGTLSIVSDELEGNITLQPEFEGGTLQVSIPDGAEGVEFTLTNGSLQLSI